MESYKLQQLNFYSAKISRAKTLKEETRQSLQFGVLKIFLVVPQGRSSAVGGVNQAVMRVLITSSRLC
jgi:hypothetical protein